MIRICVDVMGGDHAPAAIMDGVGEALDMYGDTYHLLLVGPQKTVEQELQRIGKAGDSRIEIVDAPDVIQMGEHPANAVKAKKTTASICICFQCVKDGRADAVFSAGNTGACVACGTLFFWGRSPNVSRPALGTLFPSEGKPFLLVDAGATTDCSPEWLFQFALMGSIFMEEVIGRPRPAVGLLSNGTEPEKGCKLTLATHALLTQAHEKGIINFVGNVEGHGIFAGDLDVLVCDGFVGNVFLKSSEQLAVSVGHILKKGILKSFWRKLGALLVKGAFKELKKQTDYNEYGGAPLLGVKGVCIVGHGISDAKAVRNGIRLAGDCVAKDVSSLFSERIGKAMSEIDVETH